MTVAIAQSRIIIWNYRMFCYIYVNYLIFNKKYNEALQTMLSLGKSINSETPSSDCEYYHATIKEIYLNLGDYKNAYHHSRRKIAPPHHHNHLPHKRDYTCSDNCNHNTQSTHSQEKKQRTIV
ncbi:MAG: hypothetical protein IJ150_02385 [Bacteroidales bacterium]|nr:hypothetical protein [Bacteroidales bacterium]